MKTVLVIAIAFVFPQMISAQVQRKVRVEEAPPRPMIVKEDSKASAIVDFPDVEAQFPGGMAKLQEFINDNIRYPQEALDIGTQGKVYASFVVEADGSITNVKIERGVSANLDREAKRLIRTMPKWKPGEAEGKAVRTRCLMPVVFIIEENVEEKKKK